ncbi:MAG: MBOAT family protein [Bacteroidetes bacterium]|nr:MAG: MBOAT family protein [Bacteroidota bacterium]
MWFHSLAFAAFLPVVLAGYWVIRQSRLRLAWLLLASYVFYGWWDWRFLGLIVLSSAVDYWVGRQIAATEEPRQRRRWLSLSLASNLGILGLFKYLGFFVESLRSSLAIAGIAIEGPAWNILLPVGISFYTFQTLSYTLDIYRGQLQPTRDPLAFFAFVAFFPQLVAGPIERAQRLLPQFLASRSFDRGQAVRGLRLMLYGFFKKLVIADGLARWVDPLFEQAEAVPGLWLWLAALGFSLQIYADFSAYSDIAVGVARLFGFELMTNFRAPYGARSLRAFWSRWHISLSTWFRDYVYIPLGGNRRRHERNLLITFVLSGLWHGANWTFVLWGAVHGTAYVLEQRWRSLGRLGTLLVVLLAWVLFRAESLSQALEVYAGMAGMGIGWLGSPPATLVLPSQAEGIYLLASLGLFLLLEQLRYRPVLRDSWAHLSRPWRWASYYALGGWILLFAAYEAPQQFIYFQF